MKNTLHILTVLILAILAPFSASAQADLLSGALSADPSTYDDFDKFAQVWEVYDETGKRIHHYTEMVYKSTSCFSCINPDGTVTYTLEAGINPSYDWSTYRWQYDAPVAILNLPNFQVINPTGTDVYTFSFPITVAVEADYVLNAFVKYFHISKQDDCGDTKAACNKGFFIFMADKNPAEKKTFGYEGSGESRRFVGKDKSNNLYPAVYQRINQDANLPEQRFEDMIIHLTPDVTHLTVYAPEGTLGLSELSLMNAIYTGIGPNIDSLNPEEIETEQFYDINGCPVSKETTLTLPGLYIRQATGKTEKLITH